MALSNFLITLGEFKLFLVSSGCAVLSHFCPSPYSSRVAAVGVGAIAYMMKSDVRTGTATLRRNLKHIRAWLEEQQAGASEYACTFLLASLQQQQIYRH